MTIEKGNSIQVSPIYGFGWITCETNELMEVPDPFAVLIVEHKESASGTYIIGKVQSDGHVLKDLTILMTLRTNAPDALDWNVRVYEDEDFAFEKIRGMNPKCVCTGFVHTARPD